MPALDTTDRGVYDSQNVYTGSIRALADDPSVSLIAVVQDCSLGLSARGANNYRRIAQTVADTAREIAKPVVFFNTTAGGLHPHVIEPFASSNVGVMQGARASLLATSRLLANARFAPQAEQETLKSGPLHVFAQVLIHSGDGERKRRVDLADLRSDQTRQMYWIGLGAK